jgi:DNA gyrase subunit B
MRAQLLELGLANSALDSGEPGSSLPRIEGDAMTKLVKTLAGLEESIIALERRGMGLRIHAERQDPATGKLPVYHVFVGGREEWFVTREALDAFVAKEEAATGGKLNIDSGIVGAPSAATPSANGDTTTETTKLRIVELHEVRTLNTLLGELEKAGFNIEALIPQERTGEETPRFILRRGENEIPLEDLRGLPGAIRAAGEKGLTITRF